MSFSSRSARPSPVSRDLSKNSAGQEYAALLAKREKLLDKIRVTEQHFSVSLSEPLSLHLGELLREDAQLLCELIKLS
jgi:hypothetical protein